MRALIIVFVVVLMADTGTARAQVVGPGGHGSVLAPRGESSGGLQCVMPIYPAMPCVAGDVHHAATFAESASRGNAAVIQAWGLWNFLTSEAMINAETAREKHLNNRLKAVKTYYDARQENRRRRAAERGERRTAEDYARYARVSKPRLPSPSELDQLSGEISWPRVLRCQEFVAERETLAEVFTRRTGGGAWDQDDLQTVSRTTAAMLNVLHGQIRFVPSDQYMIARRFLESLACEASQPATMPEGLAVARR